jgi:hypothetical protein
LKVPSLGPGRFCSVTAAPDLGEGVEDVVAL